MSTPNPYSAETNESTPLDQLDLFPGNYPGCGINCPRHAERYLPTHCSWDTEKQAAYADAISARYAKNKHFLEGQLDEFAERIEYIPLMEEG